jgi:hypothetical protein
MSRLADGAGAFCRGRSASKLIGKTAPEHREDGRLFRLQTRKCITQLILYLGLDLEQQIAVHVRAEHLRMHIAFSANGRGVTQTRGDSFDRGSQISFAVGHDRGPWLEHAKLAQDLLGDDPSAIIAALQAAVFADLGCSLCYAAALRVARFGTANEHVDWETAHHVFTYCNAMHQVLKRIGGDREHVTDFIEASRAVLHGALAVYLIRYLNAPPARLPALGDDRLESMPFND